MARERQAKKNRMMDCEICGEPMIVPPARYVELVKAGRKPRCGKNGCATLIPPTINMATFAMSPYLVHWPDDKRGNVNGALPKLRMQLDRSILHHEKSADDGQQNL